MDISRVIIRPLVTEKTNLLQESEPHTYAFVVDMKANKYEIISAFSALYGFAPAKVNIQIRKPAKTRTASLHPGHTKAMKIAYIIVPKGKSITIFSEQPEEETSASKKDEKTISEAKTKGQLKEVSSSDTKPIEETKK